jgi:hypothetical protein
MPWLRISVVSASGSMMLADAGLVSNTKHNVPEITAE